MSSLIMRNTILGAANRNFAIHVGPPGSRSAGAGYVQRITVPIPKPGPPITHKGTAIEDGGPVEPVVFELAGDLDIDLLRKGLPGRLIIAGWGRLDGKFVLTHARELCSLGEYAATLELYPPFQYVGE